MIKSTYVTVDQVTVFHKDVRFPTEIYLEDGRELYGTLVYRLDIDDQFFIDDLFEINLEGFPVDHSLSQSEIEILVKELRKKYINTMKNKLFSQKK